MRHILSSVRLNTDDDRPYTRFWSVFLFRNVIGAESQTSLWGPPFIPVTPVFPFLLFSSSLFFALFTSSHSINLATTFGRVLRAFKRSNNTKLCHCATDKKVSATKSKLAKIFWPSARPELFVADTFAFLLFILDIQSGKMAICIKIEPKAEMQK